MLIKPLEKSEKRIVSIKIIFLLLLIISSLLLYHFASRKKKSSNILGIESETKKSKTGIQANPVNDLKFLTTQVSKKAQETVQSLTSQSSAAVSNFIIDNTIGKVVDQVKKLPPSEQEKIKEQICR